MFESSESWQKVMLCLNSRVYFQVVTAIYKNVIPNSVTSGQWSSTHRRWQRRARRGQRHRWKQSNQQNLIKRGDCHNEGDILSIKPWNIHKYPNTMIVICEYLWRFQNGDFSKQTHQPHKISKTAQRVYDFRDASVGGDFNANTDIPLLQMFEVSL